MRQKWFVGICLGLVGSFGAEGARADTQAIENASQAKREVSERSKIEAKLEDLPGELKRIAERGGNKIGHRVSNAVFDYLTEWESSVTLDSGFTFGVQAGRTIYANGDVEESFTVVDRMSFPVGLPAVTTPIGAPGFSFDAGISGRLDFTNLRIVKPSDSLYKQTLISSLLKSEDLEARRQEAEKSDWLKLALEQNATPADGQPGDYLDATKTGDKPIFFLDSLRNARYGRIWNQFSHPLRIPLKAEWMDRLDDSEVVTYGGTGTIEVGPTLGLNYAFDGKTDGLKIGASIRAFLRGEFKISILRLNAKRARVKVTRRKTKGFTASIGASAEMNLFEGFVVAGSDNEQDPKRWGRIKDSIIPFRFTGERSWGHALDIGYEYDLADARGVQAYEQAVLGRFGTSDEMSEAYKGQGEAAPVRRVVRRDVDESSESREIKIKFKILKLDATGSYTVEEATITFPDGTSQVFKAKTQANFSRSLGLFIWKSKEKVNYSIRTDYIEGSADGKAPADFGWVAEGRIYDNSTSGLEMNRYTSRIGGLFGKPELFPPLPIALPIDAERERMAAMSGTVPSAEETDFGQADLYYRVSLNPQQLMRMVREVDSQQMWKHLEHAFERFDGAWSTGIQRFMARIGGWFINFLGWAFSANDIDSRLGARFWHADSFMDSFLALKKIIGTAQSPEELTLEQRKQAVKMIGEMYSDQIFTYELTRATLDSVHALGETKYSFHITVQSMAFPAFDLDGGAITDLEKITQRFAKEIEFDRPGPAQGANLSLGITDLKVTVESPTHYTVEFNAESETPMLLIKIDQVSSIFKLTGSVKRILVPNRGQVVKGRNRFEFDAVGGVGFRRDLVSQLEPDSNYRLTMALIDRGRPGPAVSVPFRTQKASAKN